MTKKKRTKAPASRSIGTIADAVALTGQSRSAIERLTKQNGLQPTGKAPGKGGAILWRLPEIVGLLIERPIDARQRKDAAIAELTEIRIGRERQLLLPRDQVVHEGQRYIAAVQARLRAIPPRLRQQTVDGAACALVETMIEDAISEMAGWQSGLDLSKALDGAPV